jgi:hypothetical protein
LNNDETKRCEPTVPVDALFSAPIGYVLIRTPTGVALYDLQQRSTSAEIQVLNVLAVYWAPDFSNVALITKDSK